jgi:FkbM family methyltransferase
MKKLKNSHMNTEHNTIISRLAKFVKERRSNKFLSWLRNSFIYKRILQKYWFLLKTGKFYVINAERVNAVEKILANEKSRNTYLGIMKFRQTFRKKDYPFFGYEPMPYFIEELKFGDDEVFIDCGAYVGGVIDNFLNIVPSFKQIIAFEPMVKNFELLKEKHGNNSKITLINAGVFDRDGDVLFSHSENEYDPGGAIVGICENGDASKSKTSKQSTISVKTIDGLELQNVSFIKMDVEGSEYYALEGAKKTILKNKPKLAICIYHSNEDMVRIAEYIHELVPEYKLYVRHHDAYDSDYAHFGTVLYASL